MRAKERILVVFNPSSGTRGTRARGAAVGIIFKTLRAHFHTVSIINSNSARHSTEILADHMDHFDVVAAFGGDGTINSIASHMLNSGKTLGILPGGSGNGLARNLGIPGHWKRALNTLINGIDVPMDAGNINGHYFFNVAGIGLDALISRQFDRESWRRGLIPYIYYAIKDFLRMPTFPVEIRLDDRTFQEEVVLIALANTREYGAGAIIAPFASPHDRHLDLCLLRKFKIRHCLPRLHRLYTGNIHKFDFYETHPFKQCEIHCLAGGIPFHFDGEYGPKDDRIYSVQCLPAALKIRIPHP